MTREERWTIHLCDECGKPTGEARGACLDPHHHNGAPVEVVPAARLAEVEAELAKAEPVLVAADRLREAYDAMVEGRDLGRLPDWTG